MTARARQAGKRRDNAAKEFFNHGATTGVSVHQLMSRKSRICLPQRNFTIYTSKIVVSPLNSTKCNIISNIEKVSSRESNLRLI